MKYAQAWAFNNLYLISTDLVDYHLNDPKF